MINPADIQELQYRVFHQHITAAEIDTLISEFAKHQTAPPNGDVQTSSSSALSAQDFLAFINAFLARGRAEPVWRILRFYGYNTQLRLQSSYLRPKLALSSDGMESVEMSPAGLEFISQLWGDFENNVSITVTLSGNFVLMYCFLQSHKPDDITLEHFLTSVGHEQNLVQRFASCISEEEFVGRWQ